jgi:prepilin-type N-terminal cleavage/methylation domain-containing protein
MIYLDHKGPNNFELQGCRQPAQEFQHQAGCQLKPQVKAQTPGQVNGFSLIEILVAAFVVGVALTAIATVLAYTINLSDQGVQRDAAVQLAQEGIEFFKREQVILGWNNFVAELEENDNDAVDQDNTYCLDQIPDPSLSAASSAFDSLSTAGSDGLCSAYNLSQEGVPLDMLREASFTPGASTMTIQVEVRWPKNATEDYSVQFEQELRQH